MDQHQGLVEEEGSRRGKGRAVRGSRAPSTLKDAGIVFGISKLHTRETNLDGGGDSTSSVYQDTCAEETDTDDMSTAATDMISTPDEASSETVATFGGSGYESSGYELPEVTIDRASQLSVSIEDMKSIAESTGSLSRASNRSASTAPCTRPNNFDKKGSYGHNFQVLTNYFELNKRSNFTLNQYRVDFDPIEDSTATKKALMRVHKADLGAMIFDGHMMYRTDLLDESLVNLVSLTDAGVQYKIHIRLVGHVHPDDPMFLQFYNIVMRNCMTLLGMEELGRNFFDRHSKISMQDDGLELWPGYVTAIRNHELGTFLCVEVTHKVLRTASVLSYIKEILGRFNENRAMEVIRKDLIGQIVMTHYNRKTYRVDDIDFKSTPGGILAGSTEDNTVTYVDYYKTKYGIEIKGSDVHQPMLVSFPKKKDINKGMKTNIYLVPSLCNLTGLTDEMRKNFQLMRRLSTHLHMNPDARKKKLDDFMNRLGTTPEVQEEFKRWDIAFNPEYIHATARNLGVENIFLANDVICTPDLMGDWTAGLRRAHLYVCKPLMNWVLYVPENERSNVSAFLLGIKRQAESLGMKLEKPSETVYYDGRMDLNEKQLIRPINERKGTVEFVFFILPNNQLKRYATVKKLFVLQHSIPMQCFLAKNIAAKSFNSICTKVMIQVNSKLGGEPWHLTVPVKNVMVLGFDVYHCAERKNESVGALVSTISNNLTRYFSTVSFHKDKSELSSNMCLDTKRSLDAYYSTNSALPAKIILFRDGVGEGQISFVLNHEVMHMQQAIKETYAERNQELPSFAFIIVTKKINTRALVLSPAKQYTNPAPGTVIDDIITLPERYDFFLVSQSVRQGTVSPTNYNVVYDNSGLTPDRMQRFTYKMCHLYFNWSGTVAVPAPCQYAHKLAYLTGVALNAQAPARLADLLWYL